MFCKKYIKFFIAILILAIFAIGLNVNVSAKYIGGENGTNYETYTQGKDGPIRTQEAYVVHKVLNKFTIKDTDQTYTLGTPTESYYDEIGDYLYVVEAGVKRSNEYIIRPSILRISSDFNQVEVLGDSLLNEPQGVFVVTNEEDTITDDLIYVADYGASKVLVLDYQGNLVKEFSKPNHPLYGENILFKPSKIVVDSVGTMYIQDAGNGSGLVQLTSDGEFLGYFGANYTTPTLSYIIRFAISTKEQREQLYRKPIAPTNMAIDKDGLINTVTKSGGENSLRRLNIAGENLITPSFVSENLLDIAIGKINNIYVVDSYGYIDEYDVNGNLLFSFGGNDDSDTYIGLFKNPQSISVNDNYEIFIVDSGKITMFKSTKFCDCVHEAIDLYQNGLYKESSEPWQNVLQLNNMFDLAHTGMGKAYLIQEQYKDALYHFKLGGDVQGYSDAFWELRNKWINDYIGVIAVLVLIIVAAYYIVKLLEKKGVINIISHVRGFFIKVKEKILKVRLFRELSFLATFIRHPLNGFYEVKKHSKISFITATILYVVLFVELVLSQIFTGFIFSPIDIETISIGSIFTRSIFIILLFVVCHYLISSIVQGNGSIKHVYISTICSFAPVILFMPIIVIVSNFLTLNESFIYTYGTYGLWGWSFILLFFMIKEVQELEVGETIVNILLTALTMILFVAFGFLLYALASQIIDFVKEFVVEVISHG